MKTLLPESGGGLVVLVVLVLVVITIIVLFITRKANDSIQINEARALSMQLPRDVTPFEISLYASKKITGEGLLGELFELIRRRVLMLKTQPIKHQIAYYNIHVLPGWEKQKLTFIQQSIVKAILHKLDVVKKTLSTGTYEVLNLQDLVKMANDDLVARGYPDIHSHGEELSKMRDYAENLNVYLETTMHEKFLPLVEEPILHSAHVPVALPYSLALNSFPSYETEELHNSFCNLWTEQDRSE